MELRKDPDNRASQPIFLDQVRGSTSRHSGLWSYSFKASTWPALGSKSRQVGHETRYVEVVFDALHKDPLIGWAELNAPPLNQMRWGIQMSGVRIPEAIAAALEKRWEQLRLGARVLIPEEVQETTFWEGSAQTILASKRL